MGSDELDRPILERRNIVLLVLLLLLLVRLRHIQGNPPALWILKLCGMARHGKCHERAERCSGKFLGLR